MSAPHAPVWLAHIEQLADPGSLGLDPGGTGQDTLMLVRRGSDVFAYLDACPHLGGTPMAWRKNAYLNGDGSRIVCHAHGALFDIATGECLRGPCLGQRLTPLQTVVAQDGRLGVYLPHSPSP
ncbi:Rieske (2Fe-2S) protein [Delftia sp. PS-11]|uniref:Rieske (2Fe-2S) protein n=1 Tax=Delftia sp. PS-11 TaxID=2767222 RepID=UPI002456CEE2|nr:Rieske (2Fe-2S) protein [Delftia sp. PS-11]KAJ8745523.1 Rieske (2Fe-2S) protein [Delftia sp. PS-11]